VEETRKIQQTQVNTLPITANLFGLLAVRQHRTDRAVGIQRITPRVALLLDCYRIYREAELHEAEKQALISQLLQASQIKAFIDQASLKRAELRATILAAPTDDEKRALWGQLVALTQAAGRATERLQALEGGQNG
jgi:hypothetical protein